MSDESEEQYEESPEGKAKNLRNSTCLMRLITGVVLTFKLSTASLGVE